MSLKEKYKNNKTVLSNFSYLTVLQFFILLFPFITYPYLLRVLGLDVYGKVIFAQTIAINIAIIINFGFNVSGTNNIACNREDSFMLSQIVSSIYSVKVILWILCLLVYVVVIFFVPFLRADKWLYIIAFFITFNDLLFPIWFFQGIEKMKYITFINIGVRSLCVIFIFILVGSQGDYLYVPLLNAIGAFLGGTIALYVVMKIEKVKLRIQSFAILKYYFKDSLPLFISSLSVQIYVNVSKLLVGSFLGMKEVAIYDMGEKISSLVKIPIGMISQATFPKISREKNIGYINKMMWSTAGAILLLYFGIFIFADYIVLLLSGTLNVVAVNIVRILAFSAVVIVFNYFLGYNRLIPFGYKKKFATTQILNCCVFLTLCSMLYFSNKFDLFSIAIIYVITEISMLLINVYFNAKLKLLTVKQN